MPVSPSFTRRGPQDNKEETALALALLKQTVIDNPYIPIAPTEPQAVFLTVPVKEVLFGGAAGGGKSAACLMAALQFVEQPRYAALILRRTYADLCLPGALIPRSHEWLQTTDAKWDGQRHEWKFPSGASVGFGYLDNENDKYRYQSSEFQFIAFDELTQFSDTQYRYLFSRLRRLEGMPVPLRMRAASNPGGVSHEFVKQRFIDGHDPARLFIPARMQDNPHLDRIAYEESLRELDPVTRRQLQHGDWTIRAEGNLFKREWFKDKVKDNPEPLTRRLRFWDLAATEAKPGTDPDYTAGILMGVDAAKDFWVLDAQEFRATPADVEARIKTTAQLDGNEVEVHIEQEPGASGKSLIDHYQRTVLPGYAVYGVRSSGDKTVRIKPFSAACQNGLVKLITGSWIGKLIDRLCSFGLPGEHDDLADAAGGAHRRLSEALEPMTAQDWNRIVSYDEPEVPENQPDALKKFLKGQI